jgi:hypothetical protein
MNNRIPGVICAVVLCLLSIQTVRAQAVYHKLTAADFEASPRANRGDVVAYTNCTIDFHYQATRKNGYYLLNFDIRVTMNKDKSWLDKSRITSQEMLDEILKHEQGHYTIAYMEQQELLRTVGKTVFYDDYQAQAANIFNQIDAKYKQLNYNYDLDTQHMVNRPKQNSWNIYFQQRLAYMPPPKEQ